MKNDQLFLCYAIFNQLLLYGTQIMEKTKSKGVFDIRLTVLSSFKVQL